MNQKIGRFNSLVDQTKALNGENEEYSMTRVEILYENIEGKDFPAQKRLVFFERQTRMENPDSTQPRRKRGRPTEEPELFRDDDLTRPPGKERQPKSQRSSNSLTTSKMFHEMMQQQYTLARDAKMERMDRETSA
ncbi:hypothetical protein Tco_1420327 [Tanacetum coccineum]